MVGLKNRFLIGLSCVAMALVASSHALAQFGGGGGFGGIGGMGGPQINRQQLEEYANLLGMDADQREVAQLMLEEYIDGVQTALDAIREAGQKAREEFQETRDPSAFESLRELGAKTQERVRTLETQFMEDLKTLLLPEQQEAWPKVEMTHRRATLLPQGLMSGERVDLFEITKGLSLEGAPVQEASTVLADYERALDRALAARNELFEQGIALFRDRDFEALESHFDKARDASVRVRETHRTFARRIEAILPSDALETFRTEVNRASFPTVYRESRAERALAAARGLPDLTDDQRSRLEGVAVLASRQLDQVNKRLAEAIENSENTMTVRDMMRRGGDRNQGNRELFAEKRTVVERAIEQVRSVLNESQAAQLEQAIGPERGAEAGRGRGAGEGRGRQPQRAPRREL